MATVTPNFNWPVPTSTDLVKDGATAIEALGDSIDASLVDLKGGTTGQVLSKTSNTDMDFTWVAADDTNAIQNTIVDAKGDLIAASAADTPARLAVGANGETLVADSSTATGLKWATPSGMVELASGTLSGGFLTLGSIPQTYRNLIVQLTSFRCSIDTKIAMRINNVSTANTYNSTTSNFTQDAFASNYFNATFYAQDSAGTNAFLEIEVPNYTNSTAWKMVTATGLVNNATTNTNVDFSRVTGFHNGVTAITELNILPESGGTFSGGSYKLYGVK